MAIHFLVVAFYTQGHLNPSLRLAKRLARATGGASVTFSTTVSAHRSMFPDLATPDQEVSDGLISYVPHSDGFDDGDRSDQGSYLSKFKAASRDSMSAVVRSLAERGRPVTCIIHTLAWVVSVARDLGIPSVLFWIQPATVFSIFYHFFHGYDSVISSNSGNAGFVTELPGVPPLTVREIPSILTFTDSGDPLFWVLELIRESFQELDMQKSAGMPKVLVNTFEELEPDALSAIGELNLIAIGPLLPSLSDIEVAWKGADLSKSDDDRCMSG